MFFHINLSDVLLDFSLRKIFYPDRSFSSLHLISPLSLPTGKADKTLTPLANDENVLDFVGFEMFR